MNHKEHMTDAQYQHLLEMPLEELQRVVDVYEACNKNRTITWGQVGYFRAANTVLLARRLPARGLGVKEKRFKP